MDYFSPYAVLCPVCGKVPTPLNPTYKIVDITDRTDYEHLISQNYSCIYCNIQFECETPILCIDIKKKFAILSLPKCNKDAIYLGKSGFLKTFGIEDMRFSLVKSSKELLDKIHLLSSIPPQSVKHDIKILWR